MTDLDTWRWSAGRRRWGFPRRTAGGVQALAATALLLAAPAGPPTVRGQEESALTLTAGRAALEDEMWPLAERKFREYLAGGRGAAAERESAALLLARALAEQGKHAEILAALRTDAAWVHAAPDGSGFFYWRALALYQTAAVPDALAEIKRLEAKAPQSEFAAETLRLKARCCLRQKNTAEALAAFEAFDRNYPAAPEIPENLLEWAGTLLDAGRRDDALAVLARLAKLSPDLKAAREGQLALARLLIEDRKWLEAEALLKPLAEDAARIPGDLRAEASYARAQVCQAATNLAMALQYVTNGLQWAKSPAIRRQGGFVWGSLLIENGRLDDGVRVMKSFVAESPGDPAAGPLQLALAGALLDAGKNAEAVDECQRYLETFTNHVGQAQAQNGKGQGLMLLKRYAEAAAAFGKAAELPVGDPDFRARCLFMTGDAHFANGQHKLAGEAYQRVVAEFPAHALVPQALYQTGESQARLGQADDACRTWSALADASPTNAPAAGEAMLRMAELRANAGKWQDAMDIYGRVMNGFSNSPPAARALLARGMARFRQFMSAEALVDFDQVVAMHAGAEMAEQAFYMRGMCQYRMLADKDALATWNEFLKQYPQSRWAPAILFWMGKHHYNQGQYEEAEKQFLAVADKYKGNPLEETALLRAGYAASRRNEYLQANKILSRLIKEFPKGVRIADARLAQGEALSQLGNYPAAILSFEEIINKNPGADLVPLAWSRKGYCQFVLGGDDPRRYEETINSYRVVVNDPNAGRARPDLVFESEYMIGRCLEKLGRIDQALDRYYSRVMVRFLNERAKGQWHGEASKKWFTKAAFNAADILEKRGEWRKVVNVLNRLMDSGIPVGDETRERIRKIKSEHWLAF
ncbi:MAG: tetratricopeptide repeat protein [Verrucomicrobiota bacterium]|nr:tetratricopeptide repeat protein [Verrucomicrobiota bacterium]